MAKFKSDVRNLVLQDGAVVKGSKTEHPSPWAVFKEHVFETVDKDVIERLRKLVGVSEVDAPAAVAPVASAPAETATPAQ